MMGVVNRLAVLYMGYIGKKSVFMDGFYIIGVCVCVHVCIYVLLYIKKEK